MGMVTFDQKVNRGAIRVTKSAQLAWRGGGFAKFFKNFFDKLKKARFWNIFLLITFLFMSVQITFPKRFKITFCTIIFKHLVMFGSEMLIKMSFLGSTVCTFTTIKLSFILVYNLDMSVKITFVAVFLVTLNTVVNTHHSI